MKTIREIEGLGTRLDNLKRLAEKRAERASQEGSGNDPQDRTHVEDEVFADDEGPSEESVSLHVGNSEPGESEPEKHPSNSSAPGEVEGGRFNREDAISQIIDSIRQVGSSLSQREEDQLPRVQDHSVGNNPQDKSGDQQARLSNLETTLSRIENKVSQLSGDVTMLQENLQQVQSNQKESESRLTAVEIRVDRIDRNLKSYVHQKLAPVKQKVASLQQDTPSSQVTQQIHESIRNRVEGYCAELGLPELRKNIVELQEQTSAD